MSCEAVPINRDCRGIESYGRSSFLPPFPLSSHTPPRVYCCYYHYCSPRVYFSLLRYLPRVSRPMRERTADGIAPSRPLSVSRPPPFARTGGSSFSSIAFGYRGINHSLVPSAHYLSSCVCPLEIIRGKRIPFSPVRTPRTRELLNSSICSAAVWRLERVSTIHASLSDIYLCFT